MKKDLKVKTPDNLPDNYDNDTLQGYQSYPVSEDIYKRSRKEGTMDPEDISRAKKTDRSINAPKTIWEDSNDEESGSDLDVPGSELDDEQENVGNEDEENNYYSIGGDDHSNLDEYKDE